MSAGLKQDSIPLAAVVGDASRMSWRVHANRSFEGAFQILRENCKRLVEVARGQRGEFPRRPRDVQETLAKVLIQKYRNANRAEKVFRSKPASYACIISRSSCSLTTRS